VLAAERDRHLLRLVDVLDQDAKMMEAGVIHALADLVGLEAQDRQVDRAVADVVAIGERSIAGAHQLKVERLHIEIGHRIRVFAGDGEVAQLGHDGLSLRLFGGVFHWHGKRLGAGPAMFGDVEQHLFGTIEFFLEIAGLVPILTLVDVVLSAKALELLLERLDVLDQHTEMMQAAIIHALAELVRLELEDRHVKRAVGEEHAVGEIAVGPADFLEVERLLVELGHRFGVFGGDCYVTEFGHDFLRD
jgi:hypothetical protein